MPLAGAALAAPVRVSLGALAFFLVLHPPVLEPDFHLLLGQVQVGGYLDPPQPGQVHVGGEFPLQLQELRAGEGCPHPFPVLNLAGIGASWTGEKHELQRDGGKRGGGGGKRERKDILPQLSAPGQPLPLGEGGERGGPLLPPPSPPRRPQVSYPCRGSETSGGR